jgi:hypothetical protein
MSEDSTTRQVASPDGTGSSATVAEFERALQRNAEPFLAKTKQVVLDAIEEAARKYGAGLVTEMRQTLKAAVDDLVKAHIEKMVEQLRPGGDAARRLAEGWLQELREFVNTTVRDLFEKRLPEYSRWAGQRMIDYVLAGVLFAIAAVLVCVGGVLGLREAGVPPYMTYLVGGAVVLVFGYWLLKLRSRSWETPPTAAGEPPAKPLG